jgi:hypothetical protein
MTGIEQRLRDELREVTGQVTPERLRPLRAPARRVRRRWLIPAMAAVTAAAVLIVTHSTPRTVASSAEGAMPRYYLTLQPAGAGLEAVVRASSTGQVTGTATVPGGSGQCGWEVAGAADDRHFAINGTDCAEGGRPTGGLYALTVSAAGRPDGFTALPVPGGLRAGMALSPDGSMLAFSQLDASAASIAVYGSVEIVNLATGAASTVSLSGTPGYWPGVPLWTDGDRTVIVPWWHMGTAGFAGGTLAGTREIDVSPASASAVAGPVRPFPAAVPGVVSTVLTDGGHDIIRASCARSGQDTETGQVIELSAATGRTLRVLYTRTFRGGDIKDAGTDQCSVVSADATGQHLLIQLFTFGRLDNGVFTPLPGTELSAGGVAAAW